MAGSETELPMSGWANGSSPSSASPDSDLLGQIPRMRCGTDAGVGMSKNETILTSDVGKRGLTPATSMHSEFRGLIRMTLGPRVKHSCRGSSAWFSTSVFMSLSILSRETWPNRFTATGSAWAHLPHLPHPLPFPKMHSWRFPIARCCRRGPDPEGSASLSSPLRGRDDSAF